MARGWFGARRKGTQHRDTESTEKSEPQMETDGIRIGGKRDSQESGNPRPQASGLKPSFTTDEQRASKPRIWMRGSFGLKKKLASGARNGQNRRIEP